MNSSALLQFPRPRVSRHLKPRVQSRVPTRGAQKAGKRTRTPSPERILQFAWGYAPTLILETAVSYKLFDLLEAEPRTARELALQTGASLRGLTAILNALVGLEFLARKGEHYALTAESETFLVSNKPSYHGTFFTHATRHIIPRWLRLTEAVRTGRPVVAANQQAEGPAFFAEFVEALFPLNYQAAQVLGKHLGVPKATRPTSVLDVGAGSGVWGIALAQQSPFVKVHAVDWPVVLEVTRKVARQHGVSGRLNTVAGDLLEADFGAGHDLAIVGHILHSEGRERSRQLLRKIFAALAPGGSIAISEFMPSDDRTGPPNALIFAVNMLVHTEAGDTFTFAEIAGWLQEAGFQEPRPLEAPAPSPLVLATKPG